MSARETFVYQGRLFDVSTRPITPLGTPKNKKIFKAGTIYRVTPSKQREILDAYARFKQRTSGRLLAAL